MGKKVFRVLLVMLAVIFAVSAVQAVTLTPGPIKGKFEDVGSFYPGGGTIAKPNPGGVFVPVVPGDELRNIFNITDIGPDFLGSDNDFTGSSSSAQLSGIVGGLTPIAPIVIPPLGLVNVELGNLGGGAVGAPGGFLRVYLDEIGDGNGISAFSAAAGPNAWTTPSTYPSVNTNGEQLWLDCVFIPYPGSALTFPGLTLLQETLTIPVVGTGPQTGHGFAYLQVVGGTYAPFITPNGMAFDYIVGGGGYLGLGGTPPGLTVDVKIEFDLAAFNPSGGAPPWGTTSEDPFRMSVIIPEPLSLMGLLMGVGGIGGYIRRRRLA